MSDEPAIGHNSALNQHDKAALKSFVATIERLENERRPISEDIATEYRAAKDKGFNIKAIRALIRERRMPPEERVALAITTDVYKDALGMQLKLPLDQPTEASRKRNKPPTAELERPDTSNQPF